MKLNLLVANLAWCSANSVYGLFTASWLGCTGSGTPGSPFCALALEAAKDTAKRKTTTQRVKRGRVQNLVLSMTNIRFSKSDRKSIYSTGVVCLKSNFARNYEDHQNANYPITKPGSPARAF